MNLSQTKEVLREYQKKSYYKHHDKRLSTIRKWEQYKRDTDIQFVIVKRLRRLLWGILKFGKRSPTIEKLLGSSIQEIRDHFEKQFLKGMSWDTYGRHGWCVDHIIPCSAFDLQDPIERKQCWHLSNLRPIWEFDNAVKGKKSPY